MDIVRSFHSLRQSFVVATMYQSLAHRSLAPFRPQPTPLAAALSLPSHAPIEEETIPDYDSEHFYPVNPGDLLITGTRSQQSWGGARPLSSGLQGICSGEFRGCLLRSLTASMNPC